MMKKYIFKIMQQGENLGNISLLLDSRGSWVGVTDSWANIVTVAG
jgi:hypothetical protein